MPQNKLLQKYIDKKLLNKNFLRITSDTKIVVAKKSTKIFASKFFALQLFVSQIFVHLFLIAKKQHTPK